MRFQWKSFLSILNVPFPPRNVLLCNVIVESKEIDINFICSLFQMILLLMWTKVAEGKEATMFQSWSKILTLKSTSKETEGLQAIRQKQFNRIVCWCHGQRNQPIHICFDFVKTGRTYFKYICSIKENENWQVKTR